MKGLLMKDLCFMQQQKKMFLIPLVIFIPFYFTQGMDRATFVISYMTLFGGLFAITCLSYDDYDGSMAFLVTLPVTRKKYVSAKYIFGLGFSFLFWAVSMGAYLFRIRDGIGELLLVGIVLFLVVTLFQFLMLPVQLKFGGDKGRMVLVGMVAVIVLGAYGLKALGEYVLHRDMEALLDGTIEGIVSISPLAAGAAALLIWCLLLAASVTVSVHIMEKKEF